MIKAVLVAFVVCFSIQHLAHAQEVILPKVDEAQEAEFVNKAKNKLYAGGKDEDDLLVQPQVVNPPRKFVPQVEVVGSVEE